MKTTNKKEWPVAIKSIVMAMAGAGLVSLPYMVYANPTGGQVAAGNVTIRQESATKVGITQTTAKGIIDWQKYSIGANEQVQYYQPSASSVTLNRVVGQDPSQILGRLTANGQVFLVNPNGIYFGKNAQVDVAGLVASTHNIRNEDFLAGRYNFNIPGKPGASVINEGAIRIADTGIAAFVAPSVANRGVIVARLGKVAMAAANGFTLDFHGDQLLSFLVTDEVAKTAFDIDGKQLTSFVENSGRIEAQGGYVLLTAKAAESAIHGVINQSGVIEATTVGTKNGEIILHAGKGTLEVSGTLDASAPNGGDGGFVETSGAHVNVGKIKVTTLAAKGENGTWLIDPVNFTIAANGGNMTGEQVREALTGGNFGIGTDISGMPSNIYVNDTVSWSGSKLTFSASGNIYINAVLTGASSAKLALFYGQETTGGMSYDFILGNGAKINLAAGENFSTKKGSLGAVKNFTVITSLGTAGSTTATDLQGMNGNLSKNYALGADIDATATRGWNGGEGFLPVGTKGANFTGSFAGLGHHIDNLYINRPTAPAVGLFGDLSYGSVRDVGLNSVDIFGGNLVGGLIGRLWGSGASVKNTYTTGTVTGSPTLTIITGFGNGYVGGLIGWMTPYNDSGALLGGTMTLTTSYSHANVTGIGPGGLVGSLDLSTVSNSYAQGNVVSYTNHASIGGLVGGMIHSSISNSYSTGTVSFVNGGSGLASGFVGLSNGSPSSMSYWDTQSSGKSTSVGGTGKTTAQMQQQATFTGWDFVNTWRIVEGSSYPMLRALTQGKITLTAPARDIEKVYDKTPWHGGIIDYAGFTGGDTGSSLLGTLRWIGTAEGAINAGSYTLAPTGLSSQKYEVVYIPGHLTIQPRPVDIAVSKTYNGNGTFTNGFAVSNGVVAGDATPTITGSATVGSSNAGTYNAFTTNSLISSDSNYTANPQYVYSGELGKVAARIDPAMLNLLGVTGRREYDGTTNAYWNDNTQLQGLLDSDIGKVALVSGSGILSAKDAGQRQLVSTGNLLLGGQAAQNYSLTTENSHWVITARPINIEVRPLTISAKNVSKVYDGLEVKTLADLQKLGFTITAGDTLANGDTLPAIGVPGTGSWSGTLNVTGAGNTWQGAVNANTDKNPYYAIRPRGLSSPNYEITYRDATLIITPAELMLWAVTQTKAYDGTTKSNLDIGAKGLMKDDTVIGAQEFDSKNVGKNLVKLVGYSINDGNNGNNYKVTIDGVSIGTIIPRLVNSYGTTVDDKAFDGTAYATVRGTKIDSIFGDDVQIVGNWRSAFSDKYVGNGKPVEVWWDLKGVDARNYELTFDHAFFQGNILPPAAIHDRINYYLDATHKNIETSEIMFRTTKAGVNIFNENLKSILDSGGDVRASYFKWSEARKNHSDETGWTYLWHIGTDYGVNSVHAALSISGAIGGIFSGATSAKAAWHSAIEENAKALGYGDDIVKIWKDGSDSVIDVIDFVKSAKDFGDGFVNWTDNFYLPAFAKKNDVAKKLVESGKIYYAKDGTLKLSSKLGQLMRSAMKTEGFNLAIDGLKLSSDLVQLINNSVSDID